MEVWEILDMAAGAIWALGLWAMVLGYFVNRREAE